MKIELTPENAAALANYAVLAAFPGVFRDMLSLVTSVRTRPPYEMNHRIVESNGIKMHLAEDGKGPLVVRIVARCSYRHAKPAEQREI